MFGNSSLLADFLASNLMKVTSEYQLPTESSPERCTKIHYHDQFCTIPTILLRKSFHQSGWVLFTWYNKGYTLLLIICWFMVL